MHRILMIDDDKELCAIVKQSVLQEKSRQIIVIPESLG